MPLVSAAAASDLALPARCLCRCCEAQRRFPAAAPASRLGSRCAGDEGVLSLADALAGVPSPIRVRVSHNPASAEAVKDLTAAYRLAKQRRSVSLLCSRGRANRVHQAPGILIIACMQQFRVKIFGPRSWSRVEAFPSGFRQ